MTKYSGLDYHMDNIRVVNTFNTHRIAHFAEEKGDSCSIDDRV
ncbi:MAG: hypothetical protein ABF536_07100 [Liquorilactobacillus mali]